MNSLHPRARDPIVISKRRGFGWIIVAVLSLFYGGCERYALDQQMEELCTKDGGTKVYVRLALSPEHYEEVFSYVAKAKNTEDYYGREFRYVRTQEVLVGKDSDPEKGQGRVSRWYSAIYRRVDNRLLGESVSYGRTGGDGFTFGFHPSSNSCPRSDRDLGRSVFAKDLNR